MQPISAPQISSREEGLPMSLEKTLPTRNHSGSGTAIDNGNSAARNTSDSHSESRVESARDYPFNMDTSENESGDANGLQGRMQDGSLVSVKLIVDNTNIDQNTLDVNGQPWLGNDGNMYNCQICGDFGEIVCCDGCPKVFHPSCIPKNSPSRLALDNDEDPWYCPDCMDTKKKGSPGDQQQRSGRSVKRKCTECRQTGGDLVPCDGDCGNFLHYPSCRVSEAEDNDQAICSNCRAEQVVTMEEQELEEMSQQDDDETEEPENERPLRRRTQSLDTLSLEADESEMGDDDDDAGEDESLFEVGSKRKRTSLRPPGLPLGPSSRKKMKRSLKGKKKNRRESLGAISHASTMSRSPTNESDEGIVPARLFSGPCGPVKATPAFFFFLTESRFKIERALVRKHRYFNRMPRGNERNELVAREGALWWSRLRPSEHRRYMNMSMRDYERRIIEWKEEKNIREMLTGKADEEEPFVGGAQMMDGEANFKSLQDDNLKYQNYKRLFVNTSVGSKPFVPESGESNNKILLELLQDMRFHPEPMFNAARSEAEPGLADHTKMTIPHFEVHGPISTCVGDECLGCSRGWNHFCPVLKRRMPAVENRAKLQPPLSSLHATRIGAGLRPIPQPPVNPAELDKPVALFDARDKPEVAAAKQMADIQSFSLSFPSARVDDTVTFIEEALAMKVPTPPRPAGGALDTPKRPLLSRGKLPTRIQMQREISGGEDELNKCGRCRTVIQSSSGCIPCRRAQLVINTSKLALEKTGSPAGHGHRTSKSDTKAGLVKVQTTMLGRYTVKDSNFDSQSAGDKVVSEVMLNSRWCPSAVLPPEIPVAPNPGKRAITIGDYESDGSEDSSSSSSSADGTSLSENITDDGDVVMKDVPSGGNREASISPHMSVDEESTNEPKSDRPQRTARLKAAATISGEREIQMSPDRQEVLQRHKDEADEIHRRCVSIAVSGILAALLRRDPLELFAEPVANVKDYDKVVKNPIDFGKIRSRVIRDKYQTLGAFIADVRLLCVNALAFNDPSSIYAKTAKELYELLDVMQKRAVEWTVIIKNAYERSWRRATERQRGYSFGEEDSLDTREEDPFEELRTTWPEAVEMFEEGDWARDEVASDFIRTKENETTYYGALAIRRAAAAAEASLASYPDSSGVHNVVVKRSPEEDEALRGHVDQHVVEMTSPVQLREFPGWREDQLVRVLRRVQGRRVEGRINSESGCARSDGIRSDHDAKVTADTYRWGRKRLKADSEAIPRVADSRIPQSTGMASQRNNESVEKQREEAKSREHGLEPLPEVSVSIKGSRVHGWGLFADQPFKKGDVVAEYVGEYITNAVADARETMYQEQRIQDYQFRVNGGLVIDATMHGGHGRYINHSCSPNCVASIIDGEPPNTHLKRVMIIAQRDIAAREELTYDYQFPLELDLEQRIPCNCGSSKCRGFMNWDLPEKGSKNRAERKNKRGGNMRDRIRRLGRPLKKERAPDII